MIIVVPLEYNTGKAGLGCGWGWWGNDKYQTVYKYNPVNIVQLREREIVNLRKVRPVLCG